MVWLPVPFPVIGFRAQPPRSAAMASQAQHSQRCLASEKVGGFPKVFWRVSQGFSKGFPRLSQWFLRKKHKNMGTPCNKYGWNPMVSRWERLPLATWNLTFSVVHGPSTAGFSWSSSTILACWTPQEYDQIMQTNEEQIHTDWHFISWRPFLIHLDNIWDVAPLSRHKAPW